jgi:hypothetical protein
VKPVTSRGAKLDQEPVKKWALVGGVQRHHEAMRHVPHLQGPVAVDGGGLDRAEGQQKIKKTPTFRNSIQADSSTRAKEYSKMQPCALIGLAKTTMCRSNVCKKNQADRSTSLLKEVRKNIQQLKFQPCALKGPSQNQHAGQTSNPRPPPFEQLRDGTGYGA